MIYCGCGCGKTRSKYGKRGYEVKYIRGHKSKELKERLSLSVKRENNPVWKGGRYKRQDGYIAILKPDHPFADTYHGYVLEHRLVVEDYLGRYLTPSEVIHHKNGKRDDNRLENLELLQSQSYHLSNHFKHEDMKKIISESNKKRLDNGNIIRDPSTGRFK